MRAHARSPKVHENLKVPFFKYRKPSFLEAKIGMRKQQIVIQPYGRTVQKVFFHHRNTQKREMFSRMSETHFLFGAKKNSKSSFWAYKLCCNFNVKEALPCIYRWRNFHFELFSRQPEKWPKKSSKCLIFSTISMDVHKSNGYQRTI